MEHIAYSHLSKIGIYLCFEVMMPSDNYSNNERVDLLSYETSGVWRFYELKVSKSDFHSKAKKTFLGQFNYYIMPAELYRTVKDEIPNEIGVYAVAGNGRYMECVKKPVKQQLKVNHDRLMFALMQSLSRENKKYRRLLRDADKGKEIPNEAEILNETWD